MDLRTKFNKKVMKKVFAIAVVCLFLAGLFSSCNNEACPAYGQAETQQVEHNG